MKYGALSVYLFLTMGDALSITEEERNLICNAPFPKNQSDRKKIRWLHIPKTGTSFANTVWHYGCPDIPHNASVGDYNTHFEGELNKAYPMKKNCPYLVDHTPATHKPIGEKEWEENHGSFVSVFREPTSRIESAFNYNKHCIQDCNPENNDMWECGKIRDHRRADGAACKSVKSAKCLTQYALAEPAQGCQTKMVYGIPCTGAMTMDPVKRKLAAQRVTNGFAFVGLVEEWDLSLCLFHRVLGGRPLAVESDHVREGSSSKGGSCSAQVESQLGEQKDPVDTLVYKAAKEKFEQQVAHALAAIRQQALLEKETAGTISRHLDA